MLHPDFVSSQGLSLPLMSPAPVNCPVLTNWTGENYIPVQLHPLAMNLVLLFCPLHWKSILCIIILSRGNAHSKK